MPTLIHTRIPELTPESFSHERAKTFSFDGFLLSIGRSRRVFESKFVVFPFDSGKVSLTLGQMMFF